MNTSLAYLDEAAIAEDLFSVPRDLSLLFEVDERLKVSVIGFDRTTGEVSSKSLEHDELRRCC